MVTNYSLSKDYIKLSVHEIHLTRYFQKKQHVSCILISNTPILEEHNLFPWLFHDSWL